MNIHELARRLNLRLEDGELFPVSDRPLSRIDWQEVAWLAEELPELAELAKSFLAQRDKIVTDAEIENGGPVTDFDACCGELDRMLGACENGFREDVRKFFQNLLAIPAA